MTIRLGILAAATDLEASLDGHRMAFAPERARLKRGTIPWEAA
jgi:hypothetical protein